MTTWHKGPPPSCGWWPASVQRDPDVLRWYDGEQWSMPAERGTLTPASVAATPAPWHMQARIRWTERPDWWPQRSRT